VRSAPEVAAARPPPQSLSELRARAADLSSRPLRELQELFGSLGQDPMRHRKGKTGQLIERALGATAGWRSRPDFPSLGVELKTIPVDAQGRPRESTFVTHFALADAEQAIWHDSAVRAKLAHVLWIPIVYDGSEPHVGRPWFWIPTPQQAAVLEADFDELVGLIAIGKAECVDARVGRWLQLRPKAASSRVRTWGYDADGAPTRLPPRGFYLRARFTRALLQDPTTLLDAG
jgi:DNA mismatch repair protein MutH